MCQRTMEPRGRKCPGSLTQTWHLPVLGTSPRNGSGWQTALPALLGRCSMPSDPLCSSRISVGPPAGHPVCPVVLLCWLPQPCLGPIPQHVMLSATKTAGCGFSLPLLHGPPFQVHGASPVSASLKMLHLRIPLHGANPFPASLLVDQSPLRHKGSIRKSPCHYDLIEKQENP